MKIVVLDGYTLNPHDLSWEPIASQGELEVYDRTSFDPDDSQTVIARATGAQVLFTNKTPITKEVIDALPTLEYIGVLATGYNVVDVEYARQKGIPVSNIPTYGTASVAQHAAALLLEMCNHVGEHDACVKRGDWQANEDWCFWKHPLVELAGKTMGLIGFGRIGQAFAKIACALGMSVLAYDVMQKKTSDGLVRYVGMDELFRRADVISLHCPQTADNTRFINAQQIAKMKDGVKIINTSRGQLIDERDLADALNSGKVGFAALDVVSAEPIKAGNPLLEAKNIILTPHIAWAPTEARQRLMDIAAENLRQYIAGSPVNIVNP